MEEIDKIKAPTYPLIVKPKALPWLFFLFKWAFLVILFGFTGNFFWLAGIFVSMLFMLIMVILSKYKTPGITVTETDIIIEGRNGKEDIIYKRSHITHWQEEYIRVSDGADYRQLTCYSTIADFTITSRDVENYNELKAAILYNLPAEVNLKA